MMTFLTPIDFIVFSILEPTQNSDSMEYMFFEINTGNHSKTGLELK